MYILCTIPGEPLLKSISTITYNTVSLKQFLGRAPRLGQARGLGQAKGLKRYD